MIYFDSAATTLQKPPEVAAAVVNALSTMSSPGRGGHPAAMRAAETAFACREELAELFHLENPERVVFTMNATHGLNLAIKSLVGRGDKVVVSGYEHNAVTRPLAALKAACLAKKPDLEKVVQLDDAFHQAINELGGNQMVNKISNMVRTLTHAMRRESVEHMLRAGRADELYRAHERIFTTLKNREADDLNHMVRSTYFVNGQALDQK